MYDALIVGSGAGGGPLALRLSQAGMRVLVLEKGPAYTRADYRHDELAIAPELGLFTPRGQDAPHVVLEGDPATARPQLSDLGWIACCLGGGTSHMGGSLYRFHPDDFRVRTRFGDFEEVVDWPYSYEALEPFYTIAEREVGVAGAGEPRVFGGRRSAPHPLPPFPDHPFARAIDAACLSLGLETFVTPRAMNSRPYGGRPACSRCALCAGFGCPTGARGSTQEALLPRALATGRCEIRAQSMVRRITVDRHGRASGCIYIDASGAEHRVRARIVCVCCSAVESARLLLLSTSAAFPDGLANGSGLVGRHVQFHIGSAGRALFRRERHPQLQLDDGNPFIGRSVMDYYTLPPGVSGFAKGGLLRFDFEQQAPIATAVRIAENSGRYLWGEPLKRRLREYFREYRSVEVEVFQDFLPNARTHVTLDPVVRDRWGLPVARITLGTVDHHGVAGEWLAARGLDVLAAAGADEVIRRDVGYVSHTMVHGTCRAGTDPSSSVLDPYCRSHDVPNLFVVDGSFMPTSGAAPSTLTILANSFRAADHLLKRARRGTLRSVAAYG